MAKIENALKKAGATREGTVEVNISYDIIRHVSAQLYTNPRKAIEELITNSYDAGATQCWVKVPKEAGEPLAVLDDGESMNFDGIKDLWRVAHSPKAPDEDGDAPRIENNRMQIGKFGVGKLAAFALGERLTHITCIKGSIRVVSVGKSEIQEKGKGQAPKFEVYKLSLGKAKEVLADLFKGFPPPWDRDWERWTLALVEEIDRGKSGRALKSGFLRRMIAKALPISANFQVFLDGDLVPKRKIDPSNIEIEINVTSPKFRKRLKEALQSFWQVDRDEEKPEDVPQNLYDVKVKNFLDAGNVARKVKGIDVPRLGPVIGTAIFTKTTLTTKKLEERGYADNGFAVYANGKLVNPEDELFGVSQRSHAYWVRFLARVEVPGLDRALLVQRNAVSENTDEARLTREVLKTLFNFTRTEVEKIEEKPDYRPGSFGSRLKVFSPILGPIALRGLAKGKYPSEGLDALDIEFATLGQDGPAARFDPEAQKILVNEDHPLVIAIGDLGPKSSKPMRHMIGEVLAGTQMAKGHLEGRGVEQEIVYESSEIIEVALRSAAGFVRDEIEEHIRAIEEASHEGNTVFEKAVVTAFRSLRLATQHVGGSDAPDGTIDIPISGKPNPRISVEAKGSKGVITHKILREATVSRHRKEHGCTAAIAIAREFSTKGIGNKESALLRETKGKVPLMTVAGIAMLLRLHKKRPFTYDKVLKILTTWTPPNQLERFIEETWKEIPDIGLMKLVLQVAHDAVEKDSTNLPDPGMILGDSRIRERKVKREDIIHVLNAVQVTTEMIVMKNTSDYQFELLAPVDTILEALQRDPTSDESAKSPEDGPKKKG